MEQLLTTKLYIPPPRSDLVQRHRLIERLNLGLSGKLTLVSAPAGFVKTTLVCEWVAGCEQPAAWLSLDEGDNDSTRFLAYLIAALQTIEANIGEGVLAVLQSPQPPPIESILTALLNEITTITNSFTLVLDDYHVVDTLLVDNALTFLIEHLPPQMHLVIATREDPNLPLARLRSRGQMIELRIADLRFTPSETAEFLNQVMDLNLSAEEVTSLETRTEGWIAGLQLAALSMRGREDIPGFIRAFAGDNRYIVDYLVEEVLQRQPERVLRFLLQTSILDRLCGPLCDTVRFDTAETPSGSEGTAVTEQDGSGRMLEALERGNLFVVPLDDKRQWYRYHHLFADVLQARSMKEQLHQIPTLHRRASKWYEHNGSLPDAIRHALAAEDFERTAGLLEMAWPAMDWSFQSTTWLGWVKALPDELVLARPVLSVGYAWALLNDGELEAGRARLRDAERWLAPSADMGKRPGAPAAEMVVVDEEQFRSLPATIASARAYYAQAHGDVSGSVKYAQRAVDLLPEGDYLARGRAAVLLGLAYWASGDLGSAHRSFADAMASFQMAGNILFAISFTFILAEIRMAQGRLHEAISTYERSMQLVTEQGEPVLQGTAGLFLGLSELHREQGDLATARQLLRRSEELGDHTEVYQYRLCRAQARINEAQGDLDRALDLLDQGERWLYYKTPIPDVRPTAALKARVWIVQGRLAQALDWAYERDLTIDDDLSYLREFEHVTLARVLIAQYKSDRVDGSIHEAMGLLERLLQAAEEGGRTGSVIEILVLQALAHEAQGNIPPALVSLERALTLAEPEGYVRIFVDEGMPMAHLLSEAAAHGIMPDYISKLLAVFEAEELKSEDKSYLPPAQPLIEPLSQRELEVLQLIAQGLSNREISERFFLALSTVKGHNRKIYGKLQVQRRTEAVARARELGLV